MPAITHVTVRNGNTVPYIYAVVNAGLQLLLSWGINVGAAHRAELTVFVNAVLMLLSHAVHLPEKTADGGTVAVKHVPQLVTTPPPEPHTTPEPVVTTPPPSPPGTLG